MYWQLVEKSLEGFTGKEEEEEEEEVVTLTMIDSFFG